MPRAAQHGESLAELTRFGRDFNLFRLNVLGITDMERDDIAVHQDFED